MPLLYESINENELSDKVDVVEFVFDDDDDDSDDEKLLCFLIIINIISRENMVTKKV